MGQIKDKYSSFTGGVADGLRSNSRTLKTLNNVSSVTQDVVNVAGNAVVVAMSKAWIAVGMVKPAKTDDSDRYQTPKMPQLKRQLSVDEIIEREQRKKDFIESPHVSDETLNRKDYTKLWSLKLGDYYMPLSQTFTLRAKKRINVSQLVDGIDIIQQTRQEAKTIECTLRIGLREHQKNLQLVDSDSEIQTLAKFLRDLYDRNAIFSISNDMVNNTFGVDNVIMSEYKFAPRVGMGTYSFDFTLTEVKYEENVLHLTRLKLRE